MATNNPWLSPYQRSFNSIKEQLKLSLRQNLPEITDYSEGNIFMIIVSVYAAMVEVIHYYIDNMARESFFVTARRYSSLYTHAKLVDYHIKSAVPASVDLTLYVPDGVLEDSFSIPAGTKFTSTDGKPWELATNGEIYWDKDLYPHSIKVPVVQREKVSNVNRIAFGYLTDPDIAIAVVGIPANRYYAEGTMTLYVNNELWKLVDTFAYYGPEDKVYKVELDGNLTPTIVFGDDLHGKKPEAGSYVEGMYYVTYGESGNLPSGSFNTVPDFGITTEISIMNQEAASGGSNYEDFSMLKEHVPLSVKTLGVAITKEDFEAAAKLISGVNKAWVDYKCGKRLNIYITPDNGEIQASQALLDRVAQELNKSKVITTAISVLPVYPAYIYLDVTIYGKSSSSMVDIQDQVLEALDSQYGMVNAELGRAVYLSDIYHLLDSLQTVDHLTINKLYILPKPTIVNSGTSLPSPDLYVSKFVQNFLVGDSFVDVYLEVVNNTTYKIQIEETEITGQFNQDVEVNIPGICGFVLNIGSGNSMPTYNPGDVYTWYIGPMNQDIISRDDITYKAMPIFQNGFDRLITNIYEQL